MAAAPYSTPDWRHSAVSRPTTWAGGSRLTEESSAARWVRASKETPIPGTMAPPTMAPSLSMATKVVAVPISMTMQGQE